MSQTPNKVAKQYNTVAKEYVETFIGEHEKKPMDQEILHRFSKEVGNRRPVWDFGCGPGQTTRYLRDLGTEISGLDVSDRLLEEARTINPGICFRKGDILGLDFEENSIGAIVAFYAIVNFTQEQVGTAFREIFRILQPEGIFLFTYHIGDETIHLDEFIGKQVDIDFTFFRTDFIALSLVDSGFIGIEVIERAPYPGVEYQSRRAYVFATKPSLFNRP